MEVLTQGLGILVGQSVGIGLLIIFSFLQVRRAQKKEDERDIYSRETDKQYLEAISNLTKVMENQTDVTKGNSRRLDEQTRRLEEMNTFLITNLK